MAIGSWIRDIQGYIEILRSNGDPVRRRQTLKFVGADIDDDGFNTVVTVAGSAVIPPPVILEGPQGLQGEPGQDGFPGPVGPRGERGEQGLPGEQGQQGEPGERGADGQRGADGATGLPGADGAQGADGADGAQGSVGPIGPQGLPGADGADGQPGADGTPGADGPPGVPGATGATGATGPQGLQGEQGEKGDPGADGADGAIGPVGPRGERGFDGADGRDGADGADGLPGTPGATGATGPAGVSGAIMGVATVNFGSAAQASGSFQITGLSGLVINTPVEVSMAVDTADPTESEQSCVITGIATSATVITCYWNAVDVMQGTRKVQYLIADSASNLTLSEGQMVGLAITHAGPGTNGPAVPVDGSVVGENIRFSTDINSTANGDQGTTRLDLFEPCNWVNYSGTGAVIWHGCSFGGVGGGTSIQQNGRPIFNRVAVSQVSVTFKHESTIETSAAARFSCPGNVDYTAYPGDYFILMRCTINGTNKTRVMPFASAFPQLPEPSRMIVKDDFMLTDTTTAIAFAGTKIQTAEGCWHSISTGTNAGAYGRGQNALTHPGALFIQTGAAINDAVFLWHGEAGTLTVGYVVISDIDTFEVIMAMASTTNSRWRMGLQVDLANGSSQGIFFEHLAPNIRAVSTDGVGSNVQNVSTAAALGVTYHRYTIKKRTGAVDFFIDGVLEATAASNIPTGAVTPGVFLQAQSAAAQRLDFDYAGYSSILLAR